MTQQAWVMRTWPEAWQMAKIIRRDGWVVEDIREIDLGVAVFFHGRKRSV